MSKAAETAETAETAEIRVAETSGAPPGGTESSILAGLQSQTSKGIFGPLGRGQEISATGFAAATFRERPKACLDGDATTLKRAQGFHKEFCGRRDPRTP